ncbi:hypothetical protein HR12_28325 [Microbacterium sp. SUBG005]|nr:hypothetical protein HR12_28325 [Microbacterium sp. SUBG005]
MVSVSFFLSHVTQHDHWIIHFHVLSRLFNDVWEKLAQCGNSLVVTAPLVYCLMQEGFQRRILVYRSVEQRIAALHVSAYADQIPVTLIGRQQLLKTLNLAVLDMRN